MPSFASSGSASRRLSAPISRSDSRRSGARSRIAARARSKLVAPRTVCPARSRNRLISSRMRASFSTRRRSPMGGVGGRVSRTVPPGDLVERDGEVHLPEEHAHFAARAVDLAHGAALTVAREVDPAPLLERGEELLAARGERGAGDLRLELGQGRVDPLALLRRQLVEQRTRPRERVARGTHAFLDPALRLGLEELAAAFDRGARLVDLAALARDALEAFLRLGTHPLGVRPRLAHLGEQFLELGVAAFEPLLGALHDALRHPEAARDEERPGFAGRSDEDAVARLERLGIEGDASVLDARVAERE